MDSRTAPNPTLTPKPPSIMLSVCDQKFTARNARVFRQISFPELVYDYFHIFEVCAVPPWTPEYSYAKKYKHIWDYWVHVCVSVSTGRMQIRGRWFLIEKFQQNVLRALLVALINSWKSPHPTAHVQFLPACCYVSAVFNSHLHFCSHPPFLVCG